MLLKGDIKSNKFNILVDKYVELVNSGISTSSILVILQTPNDKNRFLNAVLSKINISVIEKLNIHTFHGLIYNTISDNWIFLEKSIPSKKHHILPNLVGLEVSQLILKDILKNIKVKGYNSKKSLLHQIFRRYSLILQNNLSEKEIEEKTELLKESFASDAHLIIKNLLAKTLSYRSFDYLRQMPLFKYIYQNTDYFNNFDYLIIDDADELTPAGYDFIKSLKLKNSFIGFDSPGNSRSGYLAADRYFETKLYEIFKELPEELASTANLDAKKMFFNIKNNEENILDNLSYYSYSKRTEMIDACISQINLLIEQGIKPTDISIISPVVDDILRFSFTQNFPNLNVQFISGSEKIIDNNLIKSILNVLKLGINLPINQFDLRCILIDFLDMQIKDCKQIIKQYLSKQTLPLNIENDKYQKLLITINEIKNNDMSLSDSIYYIYETLVEYISPNKARKLDFFLKQIQDFEKVFSQEEIKKRTEDIIIQLENSIVSENPYSILQIDDNDLIVSTPQKVIDNKIITKYQIWLDVSSNTWNKSDTGPLYNSWVFQKNWDKDEYTIEDDIELSNEKTAKVMRKLVLCTDFVYAFSSLFDSQGVENFNGIEKYLIFKEEEKSVETKFQIIPRDDQAPVLEYKQGKMAISAVPGAGKTTILLALIIKLLEKKVKPENIYVLTYMESAARNFKDRIKNINPSNNKLPNITTIHGLALRILKENSNYERLGLDTDFDICDDSLKMKIIGSISGNIDKNDLEDFTRGLSVLKFSNISDDFIKTILSNPKDFNIHPKVRRFLKFYDDYQQNLKENNIIDYDDILISAVKLLEKNKDILEYYQNICEYIIEDEAQDSSEIQQKLLNLLSGKYGNIIRCGDINQAITTTFTNADVEGFYNFINSSDNVSMDRSQRCTEDVWKLANKLVVWGNSILNGAFYNMLMRPVQDKNPVENNAVQSIIFETGEEEKNFILTEIKNLLSKKSDATIGILLRNNYQVAEWESFINNAGFKVITRSESLGKKVIFKTILAILKAIESPFKNCVLADTYNTLYEQGFYKKNLFEKIKNCECDFITINPDDAGDLSEFLWDMNYWLINSNLPLTELVSKIGLCYYKTDLEISNVHLISTLVARLNIKNDLSLLIEKLKELAKRPSLSGFKFFAEEDSAKEQFGTIQIMTLHKSKGDEFDYVFIPELTEKNLSLDINKMILKPSTNFMENIKSLNSCYKKKDDNKLKEFTIAENLRLLYVAITRAKRKLYITVSNKSKSFGRIQENDINIIFNNII